MLSDKEYQAHLDSFHRLPIEMRVRCVEAVRTIFSQDERMQNERNLIIAAIVENPYTWWAIHHHGWGTWMRNSLRDVYADEQLPSTAYDDDRGEYRNWDDYVYGIVEVAFKEGIYHLLSESDRI